MHGAFESSFRRRLPTEQRRALIEAIATQVDPEATVGDVLDAAESLGWSQLAEVSLAELAGAFFGVSETAARPELTGAHLAASDDDDDADDDRADDDDASEDDDAEEHDEEQLELLGEDDDEDFLVIAAPSPEPPRKKGKKAAAQQQPLLPDPEDEDDEDDDPVTQALNQLADQAAAKKNALAARQTPESFTARPGAKKSSKKAAAAEPEPEPEPAPRVSAGDARKRNARLRALKRKIHADEPMSFEEAIELFVPIIQELGQATMQDLEEATGVGRRKLRFHVGQLVRQDYLSRHGMGRGTYYTVNA